MTPWLVAGGLGLAWLLFLFVLVSYKSEKAKKVVEGRMVFL